MSLLFRIPLSANAEEFPHISSLTQFETNNVSLIRGIKRITRLINHELSTLTTSLEEDVINLEYFEDSKERIFSLIDELSHSHATYIDLLTELQFVQETDIDFLEANKVDFSHDVRKRVCQLKPYMLHNARSQYGSGNSINKPESVADGSIARLPVINISPFNGEKREEFSDFIALFSTVIDQRTDISETSKLIYLKSLLQGNALKIISSLTVNGDNYETAKKLLIKEYDDPDYRIAHLIDSITNYENWHNLSPLQLLDNLVAVRSSIFALQTLGLNIVSEHASSTIIARLVYSKSPNYFRRALYQKLQNNYPTLDDIMNNFSILLRQMTEFTSSRSMTNTSKESAQNFTKRANAAFPRKPTSAKTQLASLADFNKPPSTNRTCCFCGSNDHNSTYCKAYNTFEERISRLNELGRCVRCTRDGHLIENCKRRISYPCSRCKSDAHFAPLCDGSVNSVQPRVFSQVSAKLHKPHNSRGTADLDARDKKPKFIAVETGSHSIVTAHANSNNVNALPLMQITIDTGKERRLGVVLIDTGSERTFIDSEFIGSAHLKGSPCRIKTVAGDGTLYTRDGSISCQLGRNDETVQLNAQITRDFEIEINNSQLRETLNVMQNHGITTALDPNLRFNWKKMTICGVIGSDNLQLLGSLQLRIFNGVMAYQTNQGSMPVGPLPLSTCQ